MELGNRSVSRGTDEAKVGAMEALLFWEIISCEKIPYRTPTFVTAR